MTNRSITPCTAWPSLAAAVRLALALVKFLVWFSIKRIETEPDSGMALIRKPDDEPFGLFVMQGLSVRWALWKYRVKSAISRWPPSRPLIRFIIKPLIARVRY